MHRALDTFSSPDGSADLRFQFLDSSSYPADLLMPGHDRWGTICSRKTRGHERSSAVKEIASLISNSSLFKFRFSLCQIATSRSSNLLVLISLSCLGTLAYHENARHHDG